MRSFRVRRQESQWGLDEDDGGGAATQGGSAPYSYGNESARRGLRRGESVRGITTPSSEDRELSGGRVINEEAIYHMRKKWISDRLIER